MGETRHKLEVRQTNGALWERFSGREDELRQQAERMASGHGQKSWRYDLYEGGMLKATYQRGAWKDHDRGML